MPEDAAPNTVVALLSVNDQDSGPNRRKVSLGLEAALPFRLNGHPRKLLPLVVSGPLDRGVVTPTTSQ